MMILQNGGFLDSLSISSFCVCMAFGHEEELARGVVKQIVQSMSSSVIVR